MFEFVPPSAEPCGNIQLKFLKFRVILWQSVLETISTHERLGNIVAFRNFKRNSLCKFYFILAVAFIGCSSLYHSTDSLAQLKMLYRQDTARQAYFYWKVRRGVDSGLGGSKWDL